VKVIASSLRKGNIVDLDGKLYVVLNAESFHPGKGTPTTQVDMRRISDGIKTAQRYKTTEQVERAHVEDHEHQFLYQDGDGFHFMNTENYDQVALQSDLVGDQAAYRVRFERLAGLANVVKLSDDDAAWIYPGLAPADVLERIRALGPRLVAITLGTDGAIAASADGYARVPAVPVIVKDTVGAGDSFLAGLVLGLARGQPRDQALRLAIAAGAAAVAGSGTARVQRADVEALYRGFRAGTPELPVGAPISGT